MRRQAQLAIDAADVIILVTDIKSGLVATDKEVAEILQRSGRPVIVCVNKCDKIGDIEPEFYEFYNLGLGDPIQVSSVHGHGTGDLLDAIYEYLPEDKETDEKNDVISVAVIGKPNAGKSSLVNKIVGNDRCIVSNIAGTTRDILEENIRLSGINLHVIDTAGIRSTEDVVEKIGVTKAKKYAMDADLIVYVVDSSVPLDENDLDILELIRDKKSIILYNKSDLDSKVSLEELSSRISSDTKIIKTSTKENTGFDEFSKAVENLFFQGKIGNDQEVMITNMRHKQALSESLLSLQEVKNSLINQMPEDFYSIDLMNAYATLGRIIGEEIDDDLVTEIFSKFCMGK